MAGAIRIEPRRITGRMEDRTGNVIATTRGDKAGFSLNDGIHGLKTSVNGAVTRTTGRGNSGRSGRGDETNPHCDEAWTASRPPGKH